MSDTNDGYPPHTPEQSDLHKEASRQRHDVGNFSYTATYIKSVIYAASATVIACLVGFVVILATEETGDDEKGGLYDRVDWKTSQINFWLPTTVAEFVLFAASFLVTLCSDGLGYVHATSLRWALYREHRLEYNTNLRLFKSAKSSFPNRWFMNAIAASSLILCYASVSMLLIPYANGKVTRTDSGTGQFCVSATPLASLGIGLTGQIATAVLCLRRHDHLALSWSPNPLWNTHVAQRKGAIEHQPGRCMLSVFESSLPPQSRRPGSSNRLLWHVRSIRWIIVLVWILCLLSFLWPVVIIYTHDLERTSWGDDRPTHFVFAWEPTYEGQDRGLVEFGIDGNLRVGLPSPTKRMPDTAQYVLCLLVLCFFQGAQALGLHCVELLVNMSRDEQVWKKASLPSGSQPAAAPPLLAALSSWRTLLLTTLKALLHWLIGQGLTPGFSNNLSSDSVVDQFDVYITMSASRLIIFAIVTAVLALFATSMVFWPIRGPQPVAWGHLQTLSDLIDDWGEPHGTLWWGDKGVNENGTRHAGTVTQKEHVEKVDMNAWYN